VRSTILTSQLPASRWHEKIGDPTLADDNSRPARTQGPGDSMRKNRRKADAWSQQGPPLGKIASGCAVIQEQMERS
jgi:hypothetical protein